MTWRKIVIRCFKRGSVYAVVQGELLDKRAVTASGCALIRLLSVDFWGVWIEKRQKKQTKAERDGVVCKGIFGCGAGEMLPEAVLFGDALC